MITMAFNGSSRKSWNTATLLRSALDGAASRGSETELIHLHDLRYSGCVSCFACKLRGGPSYGRCVLNDDLTPVLHGIDSAEVIILGSPNYIGMISSKMKSFLERLVFPNVLYEKEISSLYGRRIRTGFIYAMSSTEEWMRTAGYDWMARFVPEVLTLIFGHSESLVVNDTFQFDDYSRYMAERFDPEMKKKRRETQFPIDCAKAFDMGARLAGPPCA